MHLNTSLIVAKLIIISNIIILIGCSFHTLFFIIIQSSFVSFVLITFDCSDLKVGCN